MRNGTDQGPESNNPKQAPKLAVKANPHEQTVGLRREPMGSPAVYKPLLSLTQNEPKRRNSVIAAKQEPAPELAAKLNQRDAALSTHSPLEPMALAPSDKPSIRQSQAKTDGRSYSANIWSLLPRRRPNAGQRGSTTVTFETGPAGTLRFVQVGQSSGNARLNQLALATVRAAAPFPPPPVLKDGTPTYTIRINFR